MSTIAIALDVSADGAHLEHAAELERLGYAAIWLPGGQLDTLNRIKEVIEATNTIPVASGIISPDVYRAEQVTGLYEQLTDPDRFIVGLGASQKPPALPALHTYLDELDIPQEQLILAALGPRKLEIARTRCAGAVTLLVTPAYTEAARQALGAGPTLVVNQFVVPDDDPARAREAARGPLTFLATVGGYRANFARMGFTEHDIDTLSDHLVDALVSWGDADTIAAQVDEHLRSGADQVVLSLLGASDHLADAEILAHRLL